MGFTSRSSSVVVALRLLSILEEAKSRKTMYSMPISSLAVRAAVVIWLHLRKLVPVVL